MVYSNGEYVEYTYDALYRLTGEKVTAADKTVTEYTYIYDKVSNRILKTEKTAQRQPTPTMLLISLSRKTILFTSTTMLGILFLQHH